MKPFVTLLAIVAVAALAGGCSTAKIANRQSTGSAPVEPPTMIYVSDFDLDAATIRSEDGLLPAPAGMPGPLGNLVGRLPGAVSDPHTVARELVETMSRGLVKSLVQAGLPARRWSAGTALPRSGWLVRGVFTEANQGNTLRRAVIGFGQGRTELRVHVDLADLRQGEPRPFYTLGTVAESGDAPGAGPTIVLGPAGVAVRLVLASQDLKKNAAQTAARVADEIAHRIPSAF